MKAMYLIFICIIYFSDSFSQMYSVQLINKIDREPIPFANIGIVNKNIGTVSNVDGKFNIELNSTYDKDTLYISCIGYERKAYSISKFKNSFINIDQCIVELQPEIYELDEILVKPSNMRIYTLGNFCESNSAYGNAFYSKELGTEVGVIIKLPENQNIAYLQSFRFEVGKFTFNKFPVRVNVYDLMSNKPNKNILREPIFIEITRSGEYIIELDKYEIITNGDFFITLEYYRVPDKEEGELIFCSVENDDKSNSYYRLTSQANWIPEAYANIGFSVQVKCN